MILHDTVTVSMQVPFDPPQYGDYGEPIMDHVTDTVPAEVFPLDTDAIVDVAAHIVVSRYRMILAPQIDIPPRIGDNLRLGWGAFPLGPDNPFGYDSGLLVDGTVERHMIRGRLHHYELITKSVLA